MRIRSVQPSLETATIHGKWSSGYSTIDELPDPPAQRKSGLLDYADRDQHAAI